MDLKKIYHSLVSDKIRKKISKIRYLRKIRKTISQKERIIYSEEIRYLNEFGLHMIPYMFMNEYAAKDILIYYDRLDNFPYVLHGGKKLFFPKSMQEEDIKRYYLNLCAEQDKRSPHRYFSEINYPEKNDIFIDIGAAEGGIALEYVDKVKKVYLIESSDIWLQCLKKTYQEYTNAKVISKFVGDAKNGGVPISEIVKEKEKLIIKMDIEGNEVEAIEGMMDILGNNNKYAICTYHNPNDADTLSKIFIDFGISYQFSSGVMFRHNGFPYLRKGIIRGIKCT